MVKNNSILEKVLKVPGNKEIFYEELPPRNISLCLIIIDDLDLKQVELASQLYREQTFTNWKMIVFVENITKIPERNDSKI